MIQNDYKTWGELFSRQSVQILVAANLVPLVGVLFWNWSLFSIMFLYWFENVIIGVFNVLKISRAKGTFDPKHTIKLNGVPYARAGKIILIVFFCVHYGMFTIVHGLFIFFIFGPFDIQKETLLLGVCALLVSHTISYFVNFIGKEEYKRVPEHTLFIQPYKRVVLLHISVIFGAFFVQLIGAPILALVFFIFLKTSIDIWAHTREHRDLSQGEVTLLTGSQ